MKNLKNMKNMKNLKKLTSMMLAILMLSALCVTASAAPPTRLVAVSNEEEWNDYADVLPDPTSVDLPADVIWPDESDQGIIGDQKALIGDTDPNEIITSITSNQQVSVTEGPGGLLLDGVYPPIAIGIPLGSRRVDNWLAQQIRLQTTCVYAGRNNELYALCQLSYATKIAFVAYQYCPVETDSVTHETIKHGIDVPCDIDSRMYEFLSLVQAVSCMTADQLMARYDEYELSDIYDELCRMAPQELNSLIWWLNTYAMEISIPTYAQGNW